MSERFSRISASSPARIEHHFQSANDVAGLKKILGRIVKKLKKLDVGVTLPNTPFNTDTNRLAVVVSQLNAGSLQGRFQSG